MKKALLTVTSMLLFAVSGLVFATTASAGGDWQQPRCGQEVVVTDFQLAGQWNNWDWDWDWDQCPSSSSTSTSVEPTTSSTIDEETSSTTAEETTTTVEETTTTVAEETTTTVAETTTTVAEPTTTTVPVAITNPPTTTVAPTVTTVAEVRTLAATGFPYLGAFVIGISFAVLGAIAWALAYKIPGRKLN